MQIFNRMTHDETRGRVGVKVGDYGQGGRTYVNKRTVRIDDGGDEWKPNLTVADVNERTVRSDDGSDEWKPNLTAAEVREEKNHNEMRSNGTPCFGCFGWCGFLLFALIFMGTMVYIERYVYIEQKVLDEIRSQVNDVGSTVVHLNAVNPTVLGNKVLQDDDFGLIFPTAAKVVRQTEYCQWREIPHHYTVKVGQEPDTCVARREPADLELRALYRETCGSTVCSHRSLNSCEDSNRCCRVRVGDAIMEDRTDYNYVKGWQTRLINSLVFDNAFSYHNPQRNPFPSRFFDIGMSNVELPKAKIKTCNSCEKSEKTIHLPAQTLLGATHGTVLEPSTSVVLTEKDLQALPDKTRKEGFIKGDNRYFFSPTKKDDIAMDVAKTAMKFFLEGVADLSHIYSGTCTAGDIRVSFSQQQISREMTLVGNLVQGSHMAPYVTKVTGNPIFIAMRGIYSLPDLIRSLSSSSKSSATWTRVGGFATLLMAFIGGGRDVMRLSSTASLNDLVIRTCSYTLALFSLVLAILWFYFWGFDDEITYGWAVLAIVSGFLSYANFDMQIVNKAKVH